LGPTCHFAPSGVQNGFREMLKNAVLALFSSQSENAISALLDISTA
jgi:hypothetical protein